jgi:hypothetical protein
MGTGYPGYTGIVPNTTARLPEMLRQNGYATSAFGKWHSTPDNKITPAGPFDRWPTGKTWGFESFYGFMNGETHQYYAVLYRNTTPVAQPKTPEGGYHLTEDLVHDAIVWLNQVHATNPNQPWFMYFSTGAIHGPHHTPKAYREKYQGRFDAGWDKYREETFARQKQHGVTFSVTADIEVGDSGGEGVLAAIGGITSGWSLFVKDGKPTFYYNFFEVDHARIQSSESLPKGKSSARVEFTPVEPGPGKPVDVKLFINGKETGKGRVAKTVPFRYSVEPFDIGRDTVSPVSQDYKAPFAFQGGIEQVTIELR